jgi:hypothetical protein
VTRYARLDNNAPWGPKVQALSDAEFRAWVTSLCYSDQFLTDGHIPDAALRVITPSPRVRQSLVAKGMWHANGDGIHIHDYLQHQRSRAEVEAAQGKARRAAEKRWGE